MAESALDKDYHFLWFRIRFLFGDLSNRPPFPLTQTSFEALFDDHRKKSPLSEMCFCLLKNRRETIFSKTIFEIQIIPSFLFKEKDVQ